MQRYIGDIISDSRDDTQNADDIPSGVSSTTSGITTEAFLRYARHAQERLQSLIVKKNPLAFLASKEISIVGGTSTYSISDNVFMSTKIVMVEYSNDGTSATYYRIPPRSPYAPLNYTGTPYSYERYNGQIVLHPTPTTTQGTIRVRYVRALDRLDLRRTTIDARTINGSNQVTALSGDPATDTGFESILASARYICINDADGNVKAYNIPVSGYNSGNGDFTLVGTPTLATGETIAVGDYVTIGKYTTTHSKLHDDCERYILEYINKRIKRREVSKDANALVDDLAMIEKEIVAGYKMPDSDIKEIPIIDNQMFVYGYYDY